MLTDERDPVTGRRAHIGSISKSGHWRLKGGLHGDAVLARLREFAARPAEVATEHGRLTGRCCFCRNKLPAEESTAAGYGRICADHFGLPWGDRPAEFAGPLVRAA